MTIIDIHFHDNNLVMSLSK
jgi:hypothetical protein